MNTHNQFTVIMVQLFILQLFVTKQV